MEPNVLILLIITGICLLISFIGDPKRTFAGLHKGIMMLFNILPTILVVIIIISVLLYLVPEHKIVSWFGAESGAIRYVAAALVGSISLIQGFIAFPLSGFLLNAGVGYPVIAIFITTLLMVGIFTLPVEARYFGWRVALFRNSISFLFALLVGTFMGLFWSL